MDKRDERAHLYERLGLVLTVGIIVSIGIITFGFLLFIINGAPSNGHLPSLAQLISGILNLDASSIIWFGTLILILTPIARVVTSTILFIDERDTRYFLITLTVLILIIVSFLIGLALTRFKLS